MEVPRRCAEILAHSDVTIEQILSLVPEGVSVTAVILTVWIFTKRADEAAKRAIEHQRQQMQQFSANLRMVVDTNNESTKRLGQQISRLETAVTGLAKKVG